MKPRLTKKALQGLAQLAGLVEAGGPEEITGYDEDQMQVFARRGERGALNGWRNVLAACEWIRAMQRHRDVLVGSVRGLSQQGAKP